MKISDKKRKDKLLEVFELIKDDVEDSIDSIAEIMGQMMRYDCKITLNMWNYLVNHNMDKIQNDLTTHTIRYDLTDGMIGSLAWGYEEFEAMESLFLADKFLSAFVYSEATEVIYSNKIIVELIKKDNIYEANRLIELFYNNKRLSKGNEFHNILSNIIDDLFMHSPYGTSMSMRCKTFGYDYEYSDTAKEMIQGWIDIIENPKERGKLTIKFMELP